MDDVAAVDVVVDDVEVVAVVVGDFVAVRDRTSSAAAVVHAAPLNPADDTPSLPRCKKAYRNNWRFEKPLLGCMYSDMDLL